jgi:hypothetical protein
MVFGSWNKQLYRRQGRGCTSVAQCLPGSCMALGSTPRNTPPNAAKKKKKHMAPVDIVVSVLHLGLKLHSP